MNSIKSFLESKKNREASVKKGDWVEGFSAGFWIVVDVKPKFATEDYASWKKGDRVGDWVLLKKGFTPKMKFRLSMDYSDSFWIKPVSESVLKQIDEYFEAHPSDYNKFHQYSGSYPSETKILWITYPNDQISSVNDRLVRLSSRFTLYEVESLLNGLGICLSKVKETNSHMLVLRYYVWELNSQYDQLYYEAKAFSGER